MKRTQVANIGRLLHELGWWGICVKCACWLSLMVTHTHTLTHTHVCICACMHTGTHACMHAHTHTQTHTNTHTQPQPTHLHAPFLDKLVDIISRTCSVRQIIMGHKINLQTTPTSSASHHIETPDTTTQPQDYFEQNSVLTSVHLLAYSSSPLENA